jgi:hypothetical protein
MDMFTTIYIYAKCILIFFVIQLSLLAIVVDTASWAKTVVYCFVLVEITQAISPVDVYGYLISTVCSKRDPHHHVYQIVLHLLLMVVDHALMGQVLSSANREQMIFLIGMCAPSMGLHLWTAQKQANLLCQQMRQRLSSDSYLYLPTKKSMLKCGDHESLSKVGTSIL